MSIDYDSITSIEKNGNKRKEVEKCSRSLPCKKRKKKDYSLDLAHTTRKARSTSLLSPLPIFGISPIFCSISPESTPEARNPLSSQPARRSQCGAPDLHVLAVLQVFSDRLLVPSPNRWRGPPRRRAFESWIRHLARGSKKNGSTRDVVTDLPDDILVDILSRLPIKSLCRCKLVSTRWRNLISHPEHSKKLAQTLAGFFYESYSKNRFPKLARHFTNVSRAIDPFIDPSLSFLPEYKSIDIKDSCNGLLLCHCWKHTDPATMDSVVCNPATEKWVVVPDSGWSIMVRITRLGFNPAVSSHFHVFEFVSNDIWYMDDGHNFDGAIVAVAVYSSKSGVWSLNINNHLPIPLGEFAMPQDSKGVFFNGILHLTTFSGMVLAIDVEGKVLRGIPFPISTHYEYDDSRPVHVYLSQGHLYLTTISDGYQPSIWVLDYNGENWTLKHNVNLLHLFGAANCSKVADNFSIISIHPEHDMIFLVCQTNSILLSYEMDHMRLRFISHLGRHYTSDHIPYVPLFSESLADEQ